jgi:5'(3')-deoxyribonucleotidase
MKKNLYIDFDGVILDTITPMYDLIKKTDSALFERNIVEHQIIEEDFKRVKEIINGMDWNDLLRVTPEINDSIKHINYLVKTNKFDIAILTHVTSFPEMEAKFAFINKNIPGEVDIICVPKSYEKTAATRNCKNDILVDDHSGNLRNWIKEGGVGVKFSKETKEHPEFVCISSLDQLADLF